MAKKKPAPKKRKKARKARVPRAKTPAPSSPTTAPTAPTTLVQQTPEQLTEQNENFDAVEIQNDNGSDVLPFQWDAVKIKALELFVDGRFSYTAIAEKLNIGRATVVRWKFHPEFAARMRKELEKLTDRIMEIGIARKVSRLKDLQDEWERIHAVILERAAAEENQKAPGGRTGMLVRQFKQIGVGRAAQMVEEFVFDAALMREKREVARQAAQELGQLVTKVAPTTPDGNGEYDPNSNGAPPLFTEDQKRAILGAMLARYGLVDVPAGSRGPADASGQFVAGLIDDSAGGGNGAGPLAGPPAELFGPADHGGVQPPGREEPDSRSNGDQNSDPGSAGPDLGAISI